jgi:hypothetical protein
VNFRKLIKDIACILLYLPFQTSRINLILSFPFPTKFTMIISDYVVLSLHSAALLLQCWCRIYSTQFGRFLLIAYDIFWGAQQRRRRVFDLFRRPNPGQYIQGILVLSVNNFRETVGCCHFHILRDIYKQNSEKKIKKKSNKSEFGKFVAKIEM